MASPFPNVPRSSESFILTNASRLGPVSLAGTQQAVANPAAFWKARLGLRLRAPAHFQAARGFLAGLNGQAGTFLVGPIDYSTQPWYIDPIFGTVLTPRVAARQGGTDISLLDFRLYAPVMRQQTQLVIQRNRGGVLRVGQYLQLGDRMHIITSLVTPDPPNAAGNGGAGVVTVNVAPWTRNGHDAGDSVNFMNPVAEMRLADPEAPAVETSAGTPVADLVLNAVEA